MPKLTREQKLAKRWKRYAELLHRLDLRVYGAYTDSDGVFHCSVNGYPPPAPWMRKGKRRH